jgi:hypothetical protein
MWNQVRATMAAGQGYNFNIWARLGLDVLDFAECVLIMQVYSDIHDHIAHSTSSVPATSWVQFSLDFVGTGADHVSIDTSCFQSSHAISLSLDDAMITST